MTTPSTVLIVDDEKGIRAGLETALARSGYRSIPCASLAEARAVLARREGLDCALVDIRLGDGSGLELLPELRAFGDVPVIVATAYDDGERTIEAMRDGAFDYFTKPFDLPRLLAAVERAVKRKAATAASALAIPAAGTTSLVGRSAAMHVLWKTLGRAASSRAHVLVRGEGGTGKSLVARAIYDFSAPVRRDDDHTVHAVRTLRLGASTDVAQLDAEVSEARAGETVILSGLGDMGAAPSARLAEWLRGAPPVRVIGVVTIPHLEAQAREILAPDLYCQLAILEIVVPPLRERRSDIPLLVSHALSETRARAITEEAMATLVRHDWPGNVRELFLAVRRAAEMCGGEVIDEGDLPQELSAMPPPSQEVGGQYLGLPLREAVARLERDLLVQALRKAEGNRTLAAKMLGIPRPQLYAKLDEHGLSRESGTNRR